LTQYHGTAQTRLSRLLPLRNATRSCGGSDNLSFISQLINRNHDLVGISSPSVPLILANQSSRTSHNVCITNAASRSGWRHHRTYLVVLDDTVARVVAFVSSWGWPKPYGITSTAKAGAGDQSKPVYIDRAEREAREGTEASRTSFAMVLSIFPNVQYQVFAPASRYETERSVISDTSKFFIVLLRGNLRLPSLST
jgi:hypothetical protein